MLGMKQLSTSDRARVISLLCEGMAMRAICRVTGVAKNTVAKLLADVGKVCMAYHDEHVRNLKCKRIQVDEAWSFVYAKQKNVPTAKAAPEGAGDVWTWVAIDADTKFVASYFVGGRDGECAKWFIDDLATRLSTRVQLTSDGLKSYLDAIEGAFGASIDYAMLVKLYGNAPESAKGRYSPAECTGAIKTPIEGQPDDKHISTSFIERQNLTIRMHNRRFTRLTNAFSKKVENHAYSVALHMMYYNFVKIHTKLRTSPAMAAGVSDRLWEVSDIVALWETVEPKAGKRGAYKKRTQGLV
jgi:IS1 family transposase